MKRFLVWAVKRLFHLTMTGIGLVSTLTAVLLFALPSVADWVSRWLALVPIVAYIIVALLKDEYDRWESACLTVRVIREENERGRELVRFLEIRNCGPVTIESVDWTMNEASGWYLSEYLPRPYAKLEPGEGQRVGMGITMGSEVTATFTLTGIVDGRPYSTEKTLSTFSS